MFQVRCAYLDGESALGPLKSAYWAGWANTVHTYQLRGTTTADTRRLAESISFLQIFRRCSTTPPNTGRIRMCDAEAFGAQSPSRVLTAHPGLM